MWWFSFRAAQHLAVNSCSCLSTLTSVSVGFRPYDAVEVRVEAPDVMGGVAVGVDGGGCGDAPQWLQALLVPHVGSPRPTAVWRGQVQGRTALQRTETTWMFLCGSILPVFLQEMTCNEVEMLTLQGFLFVHILGNFRFFMYLKRTFLPPPQYNGGEIEFVVLIALKVQSFEQFLWELFLFQQCCGCCRGWAVNLNSANIHSLLVPGWCPFLLLFK